MSAHIDRNLLFGFLALQNDFVDRDGLLAAFNKWVADKSRSLSQILLEHGVLSPNRLMLMEGLVEEHVKVHENDVQQSLAALSSIGEFGKDLSRIADCDVQASLSSAGAVRATDDRYATCSSISLGDSTSGGTRFRKLRLHARGGLGQVSVALDQELGRAVALKEIQESKADDPQSRARFLQEAEVTGKLEHPGIIPLYSLGQDPSGRPFYAMRFIKGDTLREAIERFHADKSLKHDPSARSLRLRALLRRFQDVCNAIAYAHSRGVLHRDLKPGNIMLGPFGETMVVDWGLAKTREKADVAAGPSEFEGPITLSLLSGSLGETMPGSAIGTPAYASPEQVAGRLDLLGQASDVYGLGATLYTLLTGRAPVELAEVREQLEKAWEKNPERTPEMKVDTRMVFAELARRVQAGEISTPRSLDPSIPKALDAVCRKAMALAHEQRYESAEALKADLERWLADEPVEAHPERWTQGVARWARRHRAWTHAAAATLVAVTLIAIFSVVVMNQAWKQSDLANAAKLVADVATLKEAEQRRIAQKKAHAAELKEIQEKAARDLAEGRLVAQEGGVARAEHFYQKEAFDLARSLTISDQGDIREQWLKATQRALVPVATSSRRFWVAMVAYSPDKRYLVTSEFVSGSIRVWRTEGWVQERVLTAHAVPKDSSGFPIVTALAFCPDRPRELISAGQDGTVRVWDVSIGRELRRSASETGGPAARIWSLSVSPILDSNGKRRIITGDSKGKLAFWDLDSLQKLKELAGNDSDLSSVRYNPNGRECVIAGQGGLLRLWDAKGENIANLATPGVKPGDERFGITELAYSPDGSQLACAGSSGRIYIWGTAERKLLHQMVGNESGLAGAGSIVSKLAYAAPRQLFTGGGDGAIREWNTALGNYVATRGRHAPNVDNAGAIRSLAVSPDGLEVATTGEDRSIRIWDTRDGKPLAWLEGNMEPVGGLSFLSRAISAFVPEKHLLVTAGRGSDAFLRSWDTQTLRERRAYTDVPARQDMLSSERITALAIHPDGSRFIAALPNGDLIIWDVQSGEKLRTIEKAHPPGEFPQLSKEMREAFGYAVAGLAWNRKGDLVASAGVDRTIKLWDPGTGKRVSQWKDEDRETPLTTPTGPERIIAELRERYRVLTRVGQGAVDRAVMLFDASDHLLTGGRDGVIRVWDTKAERKILHRLELHRQPISAFALSADGRFIASGSEAGFIAIWDLETFGTEQTMYLKPIVKPRYSSRIMALPLSQKDDVTGPGARLAERVLNLTFAPDGSWLAAALGDGSISLIDRLGGRIVSRAVGHDFGRRGMCSIEIYFTRECELLTVGGDGRVSIWDLASWSKGRRIIAAAGAPPSRGAIKDQGAIVHGAPSIFRLDPRTGRLWTVWAGNRDPASNVSCVASDRGDGRIVFGTVQGKMIAWDVLAGKRIASTDRPVTPSEAGAKPSMLTRLYGLPGTIANPAIAALAVQSHGPLAAVAWRDGPIDLVRIDDGARVRNLVPAGLDVTALAFRPDGRFLAVAQEDGLLNILDVENGKPRFADLQGPYSTKRVCFSPDGHHLVQVGASRRIFIWDAETGERARDLTWHEPLPFFELEVTDYISGATFSPDGRWLATCGSDQIVRIWDADDRLDQHNGRSERSYKLLAALATRKLKLDTARGIGGLANEMGIGKLSLRSIDPAKSKADNPRAVKVPASVTFSPDSRQLVVVIPDGLIWVYDMETVLRELKKEPNDLLAATAETISLRAQDDGLAPINRAHLVQQVEPIDKDYRDTSPERWHLFDRAQSAAADGHEDRAVRFTRSASK